MPAPSLQAGAAGNRNYGRAATDRGAMVPPTHTPSSRAPLSARRKEACATPTLCMRKAEAQRVGAPARGTPRLAKPYPRHHPATRGPPSGPRARLLCGVDKPFCASVSSL